MANLTPRLDKLDKNYFINGAMDFFQRSTASVTIGASIGFQTCDRFSVGYNTGGGITSQTTGRSTVVPDVNTQYSLRMSANAPTSAGSLVWRQRIESKDSIDLAGKNISISFWVRSESASRATVNISIPTALDNYTSIVAVGTTLTQTLTVGTTWQLVTFENIAIPASANLGLQVAFGLDTFSITGSIKDHYVTNLMLNNNSSANIDFARAGRNVAEELQLCQRYFCKSVPLDTAALVAGVVGPMGVFIAPTTTECIGAAVFPTSMRIAAPTITLLDDAGNLARIHRYGVGNHANAANAHPGRISENGFAGVQSTALNTAGPTNVYVFNWIAEAEL